MQTSKPKEDHETQPTILNRPKKQLILFRCNNSSQAAAQTQQNRNKENQSVLGRKAQLITKNWLSRRRTSNQIMLSLGVSNVKRLGQK